MKSNRSAYIQSLGSEMANSLSDMISSQMPSEAKTSVYENLVNVPLYTDVKDWPT